MIEQYPPRVRWEVVVPSETDGPIACIMDREFAATTVVTFLGQGHDQQVTAVLMARIPGGGIDVVNRSSTIHYPAAFQTPDIQDVFADLRSLEAVLS